MAVITVPFNGIHDKGVHTPAETYKFNATVRHPETGVRYIAYAYDVPAEISLSDTAYWRFYDDGDAQLMQEVQDLVAFTVPSGGIIMWSGAIGDIPAGWVLCDGQNGTPNLRNRFVVGAGNTYSVGNTGGSANAIVVSHSHTMNHDHPNVSTSAAGNHRHYHGGESAKYIKAGASGGSCYAWYLSGCSQGSTTKVGDGYNNYAGNHTHTLNVPNYSGSTGSKGTSGTNKNLPPYYALAYIMKT